MKILRNLILGGSTDMFIPFNEPGTKVYPYDVNSLYPTNMSKGMSMPVVSRKKKELC